MNVRKKATRKKINQIMSMLPEVTTGSDAEMYLRLLVAEVVSNNPLESADALAETIDLAIRRDKEIGHV